MGKIIGGGLPVGALGGRADIMDTLAPVGPVYQAGTLSGNPLAMAAGIASLKKLNQVNPYSDLEKLGSHLRDALLEAAHKKGIAMQVPQVGSMFALFFSEKPIRNLDDATSSDLGLFNRVFHYALTNGVYLPPSPYETCFLSTAHRDSEISHAAEVLRKAIETL